MYRNAVVKPRRPLHGEWPSEEFSSFSKSNNIRQMASVQPQRQQSKSQKLQHQQHLYGGSMDPLKYPVSVLSIEDGYEANKPKIQQSALKEDEHACKKIGAKVMRGFDEYCDTTTLHGLKYVGDNSLGMFERSFWFIAFSAAVILATYFIASLYSKFNTSPMVISFNPRVVFLTEIPFPAITICNVNLVLKSKAEEIENGNSTVEKQMLNDICNVQSGHNVTTQGRDESSEWETVKNFIINVNQKCDDLIKYCKWDGNKKVCDTIINSALTDEGYCCAFNRLPTNLTLRDNVTNLGYYPPDIVNWNAEDGYGDAKLSLETYPYRSQGQGQGFGLTLVLDAQTDEYHCTSTNSMGFKVMLSNPTENPKIAEIGFLIAPGDETRITIQPDIKDATEGVKSIHIDKRQCFFARERSLKFFLIYSEKNCRSECESNYTIKQCNCVPYYLPRDQGTPICGKGQEKCSDEAKLRIERFTSERLSCRCLPSCHDISYSTDSMSVGKIRTTVNTVNAEYLQNFSYGYFVQNMAVVHFFFDTDKFPKQTKSELYGFSEFLSNTGGLLGLFCGFSFLSAVEIIYFIFFRGTCRYYRNERQRKLQERQEHQTRWAHLPFIK